MVARAWSVHKFGGTSLADAKRYRAVAEIIQDIRASQDRRELAVVVSAMSGVTDALIELVEFASRRNDYSTKFANLKSRHHETLVELRLGQESETQVRTNLEKDFRDIDEVLRGVWQLRAGSTQALELVSGYGEIWSAQFLSSLLRSSQMRAKWLNARDVLVVESSDSSVRIEWEVSALKLGSWLKSLDADVAVITGFVASTIEGLATTLKRNGSDFSASIFASLLGAQDITIWTDVDGVMTADPRLVPEAVVVREMTYDEATELAYFGAKVLHPSTMAPAIRAQIPIFIRNTLNPSATGTRIAATAEHEMAIKGFSTMENMALVNLEGNGMVGVPGVAHRLFGALKEISVSVIMISQASSEHSICFAIPAKDADRAKRALEQTFAHELKLELISKIDIAAPVCVLAIVGEGMVEHVGVAGKFFGALGRANVNIRAIAQGSSERNISVVVGQADSKRALRAAHSAFYLAPHVVSIGLVGPGLIGGTFLRQLAKQVNVLREQRGIHLQVRGIANSKKMLCREPEIDLNNWQKDYDSATALDWHEFCRAVAPAHVPLSILVDATVGMGIPVQYKQFAQQGCHLVTCNKMANAGPLSLYQEIVEATRNLKRRYFYSTTVGAGLPIIQSLRDMIMTGDEIISIEGIFSGTLSYLFNQLGANQLGQLGEGQKFSEVIASARTKGYTEPDPRDDLSGQDVARKLTILAREMGWPLEAAHIAVENLVPEELQRGSIEEFMSRVQTIDDSMDQRFQAAQTKGTTLRYIARLDAISKTADVRLREVPLSHPFAGLTGTDNIVAFQTRRYSEQPLIIRGPGAGPEVTAGGLFNDVLRLTESLVL